MQRPGELSAFLDIHVNEHRLDDLCQRGAEGGDERPAVGGVLDQHGFNLLWIGFTNLISAIFIWRANMTATWVTALVGGLADVGYFIFVDLPGFANFIPGTLMTIISGPAILLSGWVWFSSRPHTTAR